MSASDRTLRAAHQRNRHLLGQQVHQQRNRCAKDFPFTNDRPPDRVLPATATLPLWFFWIVMQKPLNQDP